MKLGRLFIFLTALVALMALAAIATFPQRIYNTLMTTLKGRFTIEQRVQRHGEAAHARMAPYFERAGVAYPPATVILVGLKQEKRLELYAGDDPNRLRFIRDYPILAASGTAGPKLRRGDRQVPEGIYRIESLNPNSNFHLSLRVEYPNAFDRMIAQEEGRADLGSDIMIHGGSASVGCLAMGDPAIEELFVLAAQSGLDALTVILCPNDLRFHPPPHEVLKQGQRRADLYDQIKAALPAPPPPQP